MILDDLKILVEKKRRENIPDFLIVNFLKEYLQYPVLDFLYKDKRYRKFIFTGGSCLRICFDLPRLSEDLDFDLKKEDLADLDPEELADELKKHFKDAYMLDIKTRVQKDRRIYLKFSILNELGLAFGGGSDFLYVKIEPSEKQFPKAGPEVQAISNYGYNFIVRRYSLSDMMTGKIVAVFTREWFKGKKNEVDIKGRDFYDLFWFFQNGVKPDYGKLKGSLNVTNKDQLNRELRDRIDRKVTSAKLKLDLKNFLTDRDFAEDFCDNYSELMREYIGK